MPGPALALEREPTPRPASTTVSKPGGYISPGGGANSRSQPASASKRAVAVEVARVAGQVFLRARTAWG